MVSARHCHNPYMQDVAFPSGNSGDIHKRPTVLGAASNPPTTTLAAFTIRERKGTFSPSIVGVRWMPSPEYFAGILFAEPGIISRVTREVP